MRLHHVQVACPPGGEDEARRFYRDGLGMTEVDEGQRDTFPGLVRFHTFGGHGNRVEVLAAT